MCAVRVAETIERVFVRKEGCEGDAFYAEESHRESMQVT